VLLFALNGIEAHARPPGPFADRLGIDRVILLPPHERFYIGGRDQPNVMTKLGELTSPVMCYCPLSLAANRLIRLHTFSNEQLEHRALNTLEMVASASRSRRLPN
jgi:hypothetical protein